MKFFIEQLVLWPVNEKNKIHSLVFQNGKINIIHGRSRTGKSSIIAIVDYCLGASRCAIPVGIIRDNVEWFGIIAHTRGTRLLIARRTPKNKNISNEFYLKALKEDENIPDKFSANYNDSQIKNIFNNRLIRLTNLTQNGNKEVGQFDGRPSYRDLAAFNFLPQHIVANPNTLFYKADSYDHKERLRKILPLALGIVDNDFLLKERERLNLQKELDNLIKQRDAKIRSNAAWESEVELLWNQAIELGLIERKIIDNIDAKINEFKEINNSLNKDGYDSIIKTPDYLYTNEQYKNYKNDEEIIQKEIDKLRIAIRHYENSSIKASNYSNAIYIEKSRVVNFSWLKNSLSPNNECVACGSTSNQLDKLVSNLEIEVNKINQLAQVLFENPIVDKEIEKSKNKLLALQINIQEVRMKRLHLEKIELVAKDSLSRVFILVGRIQALLLSYAEKNNENDLGLQIRDINFKIHELDHFFMMSGKNERELAVYKQISSLITSYAEDFKLEQRGSISLDNTELTLSFKKDLKEAKKEYLWEVGSGANWMGYHIATFLGIHQFLSTEKLENSPVFRFLIIDQPSQVYFPSAVSGANQLDTTEEKLEKLKHEREDDIQATKKIFEMLELGLKKAAYQYQIIVLEHADQSIWGDQPFTVEVANWKAENTGLIPLAWLEKNPI